MLACSQQKMAREERKEKRCVVQDIQPDTYVPSFFFSIPLGDFHNKGAALVCLLSFVVKLSSYLFMEIFSPLFLGFRVLKRGWLDSSFHL